MRTKDDDAVDPHAATLAPSEHDPDEGAPSSLAGEATDRSARPSTPSPPTPPRLGRYTLLGVLGKGGMGVVHEALDEQVGRRVALKLLHAELGGRHAERLVREARALARLSHPNVVQVYEVGRDAERCFIAMELVTGRTLRDWQRDHPPWRECVKVYLQAGRGLAAAHAAGMTHRDFKPGNCILDERGRVRVLDFGLARQAEDASLDPPSSPASTPSSDERGAGSLTRTGEVLGTLGYMPLEQLEGKRADARSDQWSFCASLYEALYRERPFAGDALGSLTLALMHEELRPAPKRSAVPRRLRRVLLRGLAKDPAARWPSMDALLAELSAIVGARRTRWTLAAGGVLVAGLVGLGLELFPAPAPTIAAPVDAPRPPGAVAEDGQLPSALAIELREHAEELFAAHRIEALRDHLERIAPGESLPDDPTLAAEVLFWRGRISTERDMEGAATLLRRAHTLARDADVPSIESRAAGAMTGNMVGAHTEGVDGWMRLAWLAVERTPWDRSAAIEVAVTAARSTSFTWRITRNEAYARALLEFADAVVGEVELDDDAFVVSQLLDLADGWRTLGVPERSLHWALAARSLLAGTADSTHPLWAEVSEELGRSLYGERRDRCAEGLVHLDDARAGYLRLGDGERASRVQVEIGDCLAALDRLEPALEQARAACEHWAEHRPMFITYQQDAHLLVARLLTRLGRTDEARAEYERILALVDLDSSTQKARELAKQALDRLGPPARERRRGAPVKDR